METGRGHHSLILAGVSGECPFNSGGELSSPVSIAARSSWKKERLKFSRLFVLFSGCGKGGAGDRVGSAPPRKNAAPTKRILCDKFPGLHFIRSYTAFFSSPFSTWEALKKKASFIIIFSFGSSPSFLTGTLFQIVSLHICFSPCFTV